MPLTFFLKKKQIILLNETKKVGIYSYFIIWVLEVDKEINTTNDQ